MKHASLFTGIGGFDLAAQWMGWENVFQVEIDEFCQKVLEKNFPNVKRYGDIKQFNGTEWAGKIDVLTGGFPCQPFSVAGSRKGKEDNRFLWPEMLRTITEVKPRWIVGENVTGIIGLALDQVLASLEGEGYNTETYIIPACAVDAPHRRDRVWIIAYSNKWSGQEHELSTRRNMPKESSTTHASRNGLQGISPRPDLNRENGSLAGCEVGGIFEASNVTDTNSGERSLSGKAGRVGRTESIQGPGNWEITSEPFVRRGTHGISNRMDRIKSLGNAIVPQVAFEIFKAISSTMK